MPFLSPVQLVGAGPGDPDLLTLGAAAALRQADVVFHDALISREVLSKTGALCHLVPVGKRRGQAHLPQAGIIRNLISAARSGRRVVRLKGGDPFVFGRGGEEAQALRQAGVPFRIVPGVCSGTGVPGLLGIPLTSRGVSGSAAFLTAHDLCKGKDSTESQQRLVHLARGADTLVIFMAREKLDEVRAVLMAAGLAPDTPVAVIEDGSASGQRLFRLPLNRLSRQAVAKVRIAGAGERGPALLVVGNTVALGDEIRGLLSPPAERKAG